MLKSLLRQRGPGSTPVTNTELFFDLIYVFAITQISHRLLVEPSWHGAADAALLLAMVWLAWVYTAWVTNWLDPDALPTRVMLMLVALGSLVMSAGLPEAFEGRGLWVGGAYAAMQVGRSAYTVAATRGEPLQANYQRILTWCLLSGALAIAGGFSHGHVRELLWAAAVAVDVTGGLVGFWTPGLGRSGTEEWTIEGGHFAERCQAFVLIALGESVVATGTSLSEHENVSATLVGGFAAAFAGVVVLWWLYFGSSAERGILAIKRSHDPGRLARSAYHLLHPVMVAGIVATAAGDEKMLAHPSGHAPAGTSWLIAGGSALFVVGHALYLANIAMAVRTGSRTTHWTLLAPHTIAVIVLLLVAALGSGVAALACGVVVLAVLLVLTVVTERRAGSANSLEVDSAQPI